jgi:hypothetical protein
MGEPGALYTKEGRIIVVKNEKDELIPQPIMIRWRMCIDYMKLNKATRKGHFPLPFIDEMLERLAKHSYFYFLDGCSGFMQILIHVDDQQKPTFTCLYGSHIEECHLVYVIHRLPFKDA